MLRLPSGRKACQAGSLQKPGRLFSILTSPVVSSDSSVLTAQTFLPVTLSLTFCNHEILMTDIEFKVQFMSESSGGKGSCKSTAFQVIEGFQSGAVQQLSGRARRSGTSRGSVSTEHGAAGSLCAGVGASGTAVPSTQQFPACRCLGPEGAGRAPRCSLQACGLQLAAAGSAAQPGRTLSTLAEASGKLFFLFPQ